MANISKKSKKRKNILEANEEEPPREYSKKKKQKKTKAEPLEMTPEHDIKEEEDDINHEDESPILGEKEFIEGDTWTKEEYFELIKKMESVVPKNDTLSFRNRVEKLPWSQIQVGSHSSEECYGKWTFLKSKVRHFRLLGEILQDLKVWVENPWAPSHNKKKNRHPDQPTRPLSSFMLFYMDKKDKYMKRNPGLKLTEISTLIGEKFKALPEEKKTYYQEKAKYMLEEYKQKTAKFYEKHPELYQILTKKEPTVINNRPLPPFKLYLKDRLQKHEKDERFNHHDFIEKYKEMWKHLGIKKKAYWIRLAQEEEQKYLEQQLHEDLHDGEHRPTYKSVLNKEEKAILDRLAGKPEKPPNSAYSLFSRLMLQNKDDNHVDGEPKNRMREVANMWKELPDEKKREYVEKVQHMIENYKLEFASYLESLPEDKKAEELAKLQPKKKNGRLPRKRVAKKVPAVSAPQEEMFKNEPEKPPVTAWDLYKQEFCKRNSHLTSKVAYKEAAASWKTLSKEKIEKYKRKHNQLKKKYIVDFEAFLKTLNENELKEFSLRNKKCEEDELDEESEDEETSSDAEDNNDESSSSSASSEDSGVSGDES